jgi:hypothetical protein
MSTPRPPRVLLLGCLTPYLYLQGRVLVSDLCPHCQSRHFLPIPQEWANLGWCLPEVGEWVQTHLVLRELSEHTI